MIPSLPCQSGEYAYDAEISEAWATAGAFGSERLIGLYLALQAREFVGTAGSGFSDLMDDARRALADPLCGGG